MSITPSERTYNTLAQSYNEPEKLNIFQRIIHFIRDILRMDVLDNHLNSIAQRLHDFEQYPNNNELSTLMDTVLELKNLTKSELQKNYVIVQLSSLKKNEDTGAFYIANDKIIFMFDEEEIAEYANATFLNEDNNIPDVQTLLINSDMPIRKGYVSCQYKEMENCFNDIAMTLRRIRERDNPEIKVDFLNLKASLEKLDALIQINDFMRANKTDNSEDIYRIKLNSININLKNLSDGLKGSNIIYLLNELTNSIYSLKKMIAEDTYFKATIDKKDDEINKIKYSECGGKSSKIEGIKQEIDNIESLIQYCKNALNPGDITKLA